MSELSPTHDSSTSVGLLRSTYGAELGYFVSDHVEVGAGVSFSHDHTSQDSSLSSSSNATVLSVLPRIEYAFGGERVRPYLAGFGGYQRAWYSSALTASDYEVQRSGFMFGGGVGAHLFLGDSWSLDPELGILRTISNGTQSTRGTTGASAVEYEFDDSSRTTAVVLSVGLSGWFGGR